MAFLRILTIFPKIIASVLPGKWQTWIKLVLYLVVFDGVARKWMFPGQHQYIYFVKDLAIMVAYCKYGCSTKLPGKPRGFYLGTLNVLLITFTCYLLIQLANPNLGSPVIGFLGLKVYLLYVPLIHTSRQLFIDVHDLKKFWTYFALIPIPLVILALVQSQSPKNSYINRYTGGLDAEQHIVGLADSVRVAATFSYISGYQTYLPIAAGFVLPLLILNKTIRSSILIYAALGSAVLGALMTGSRGAIIGIAGIVIGFICIRLVSNLSSVVRRLVVPLLVFGYIGASFTGVHLDRWMTRGKGSSGNIVSRVTSALSDPIEVYEDAGVFGYGPGSTHQAKGTIEGLLGFSAKPGGKLGFDQLETEPSRITYELGLVGFVLWYIIRILLVLALWRTYRFLKAPFLRGIALSGFILHVMNLPQPLVVNIIFQIYYWFFAAGIVFLPYLEMGMRRGYSTTSSRARARYSGKKRNRRYR